MPFSMNGIGTTWYGHALEEPDGSYVVTEWVILLFIPIIPLGSKRIWAAQDEPDVKLPWWKIRIEPDGEKFNTVPVPLYRPHLIKGYSVLLFILFSSLFWGGYDESSPAKESVAPNSVAPVAEKEITPEDEFIQKARTKEITPEDVFIQEKRKAEAGDALAQTETAQNYLSGYGVQQNAIKAVEWIQKAVAQNFGGAKVVLGYMYAVGAGVPKDADKAKEWFQKAEDQGDALALFFLGEMYAAGGPVPKNPTKALELYLQAAEKGHADAQHKLGQMYAKGKGVPRNPVKGAEFFEKEASQGTAGVKFSLGEMYAKGDGIPKSPAKAQEWFEKAAVQGGRYYQFELGKMYAEGDAIPKNKAKAVEWLEKAAMQGDGSYQFELGEMYATGKGLPEDADKALEWLNKGAMQGGTERELDYAERLKWIGDYFYRFGRGDVVKAQEWYRRAAYKYRQYATQGNASAQRELGDMYRDGLGVSKDAKEAVTWLQKSAAQGDNEAQLHLAMMYDEGDGVLKDDVKAVEWYGKSAAQGNAIAQYLLARMYSLGEGVNQNPVIAYAWANLASVTKSKLTQTDAKELRDAIEAHLTPEQRIEGQRLSSNWKKGEIFQSSSGGASTSSNDKPEKQYTGTAFAVSNSGHALTNHHIVASCTELKIAGRDGIAKVITSDSTNDLALLQLPGNAKDIAHLSSDPSKLRQGEDIIVFGYPLNSLLSSGGNLTLGTVSALTGLGNNTNQIQISAPIQPGSSGSPVMDKKGNVVGVVSMKLDDAKMAKATGQIGQNVNFAINGQTVKAFLDANKIPYKTSGGFFSLDQSNADIAEEARKWTVLVECWK